MYFRKPNRSHSGESGYVLLALMLVLTLMLIAMSIEAPRIAQQIKRQKEEELVHRGKEYATAVKRFVHKNGGRYPASVEQLEDTNHIRFLRKKFKDPMTGESDWKMVHAGEAQIKIPTPNPGLSGPGGANPGLSGPGAGINPGGTSTTPGATPPPPGIAQLNNTGGSTFGQQPQSSNTSNLGSLATSNIGNGQTVGGGQIIGVASTSKKQSIKEFNDKDEYDEWYFVYDLRLEQSGSTGVTVAEPRVGGSSTTGSSTTGGGSTTGTSGTQPPPAGINSGQPPPTGTPQPPPQVPN
jgi:type II secretory pathway pseudopilin PulG